MCIVGEIEGRRLKWFVCLKRTRNKIIYKKIVRSRIFWEGKERGCLGKSKWMDGVRRNMISNNITGEDADDRELCGGKVFWIRSGYFFCFFFSKSVMNN